MGTLTVEEVYKDREQFAALVRDVASPDVGKMGVEILSFTIKDVHDDVDYLESLGKSQTASVKRDAEIGVAQVRNLVILYFGLFDQKNGISSFFIFILLFLHRFRQNVTLE